MEIQRTVRAINCASKMPALLPIVLAAVFGWAEARAGGYGTRETVGSGADKITLVKVGGTRYQMGYWYGRLLADEIAGCWASLSAAVPFTQQQYNNAVAAMWKPTHFDTVAYDAELHGIADGCEDAGRPEVTFEELQKMQLLPDMSEFYCSLFAAWGNATADGHLYQLRNLDWSMDTGIQDYPVVAIFEPEDGYVHAVIGFAGLIGAAVGGISENGIAQSEIMGHFCDSETLNGIPFPFLLRDILYYDKTLAQALSRIEAATRTNQYHYGISGPDDAGPGADPLTGRLLMTSNTRCDIYADGQSVDPHPCINPSPFHTSFADVVYWSGANGGGNEILYNAIAARYGAIDSNKAIEIGRAVGVSSTLMSVVYDTTSGEFWVACADGLVPAHNKGYVHFDLNTPHRLTALDSYVAAPDASYTWSQVNQIGDRNGTYTAYVLDMTSQTWLTSAEVDRPRWRHWVTVIIPNTVSSTTAFLWIGGGSNGERVPTSVNSNLAMLAKMTKTVVAELRMVPNQPLRFTGDVPRWEDALIAYCWDKFLTSGEEVWVTRLPMTKAAVRAMDTVEEFCASAAGGSLTVDRFVVAGASKRGWTTWTTAAVDSRVVAIAPMVIDVLNVERSMSHHWAAYGFWAAAVHDYEDMGIMDWFSTPELEALMAVTDPYSYRARYTMPKFIINSSGDDFFLPDSSKFYFDDLPGEKHLRYVPNTDHGLGGSDMWDSLLAFYESVVNGWSRPLFSWTSDVDGSIRVQTVDAPKEVNLWQATNPSARDFRKNPYPAQGHPHPTPTWHSSGLSDLGGGLYVAQPNKPPAGWTAFFVELVYDGTGTNPYKFTTGINVIPQYLPFACDLDRSGDIDLFDMDILVHQWLQTGELSADVAPADGDGTVDFLDFATFGRDWSPQLNIRY